MRAPAKKKRSSSNDRYNTKSMQLLQLQEVKNDDDEGEAVDRTRRNGAAGDRTRWTELGSHTQRTG